MAFRRQPSNPNPYPFANPPPHQSPASAPASAPAQQQQQPDASPPHDSAQSRKRPRAASDVGDPAQQDPFHHENGSDASDASDDGGGKPDKKAGRRKIKIEFIQDKSRRHITFSKRKAGIMKKAYELSTLTGTQVLLLVVSETGLVYTFTTAKLQPLVTQPEGKNLIQACLNAPHGSMPSSLPVGSPIGRNHPSSSAGITAPQAPPQGRNVPGGLSIGGDKDQVSPDHPSSAGGASADHSGDHPDRSSDDPHSPRVATRRPSNAPPPSNKDSPPRKPSSSSPSLLPLQYPNAYAGLTLDPGMYGHHAQQPPPPPPQYLPQQQTAQQQGPQGAGYMGGAQWQPGQAGYARR